MIVIYAVIWAVVLIGVLHLAVPSETMRYSRMGNGVYYLVWSLSLALMLTIHYKLMAQAGHGMMAIACDVIATGVFCGGHCGLALLRRRWRDADAASMQETWQSPRRML